MITTRTLYKFLIPFAGFAVAGKILIATPENQPPANASTATGYQQWANEAAERICILYKSGQLPQGTTVPPSCLDAWAQTLGTTTSSLFGQTVRKHQQDSREPEREVFFTPDSLPASNPLSFQDAFEKKMEELQKANPSKALQILGNIMSTIGEYSQSPDHEKAYILQRLGGPQEFYRLYDEKFHLSIEQYRRVLEGIVGPSLKKDSLTLTNQQICDAARYISSMRNLTQGRLLDRERLQQEHSIPIDSYDLVIRTQMDELETIIRTYSDYMERNNIDCSGYRHPPEPS